MALASSCSYPDGYFNNLGRSADEDLENERNDVRDIFRSTTNLEHSCHSSSTYSLQILERLVSACLHAVQMQGGSELPPESAVHCLSALAKPLNVLTSNMLSNLLQKNGTVATTTTLGAIMIVQNALQTLSLTCGMLLGHYTNSPISTLCSQ